MEQNNLEEELNNLIREAAQWKTTDGNPQDRVGSDTSTEMDACLTAIANAITNYVTVEITRRLTVPSEPTPPLTSNSTPRKSTLTSSKRAGSSSRINNISQPSTPIQEYYSLKKGPQYHSENRLDRFSPAPRPNETPLENKASRLRRLSTERRRSIQK